MLEATARDEVRIAAVARLLGLDRAEVVPLVGGTRNRCYRLAEGSRELVVRLAGDHDAEYAVARRSEAQAQRLAAAHGLAPRLLHEDLEAGVMVMDFVAGPVWDRDRARSPAGAACAGDWIRRLHGIAVPAGVREVDFRGSLEGYCGQLADREPAGRLLDEAARRVRGVAGRRPPCFCHNDLHHLNLVQSPAGLRVLDWEYAGIGDPLMDLAGFAAYHDLEEPCRQALLEAYAGHGSQPSAAEFDDARWLFEAVWWAWLELKRQIDGEEPADAGLARDRLALRLGLQTG